MRIGVAAVDGGFTSGLAAVIDVIRTADLLRAEVEPGIPPLVVDVFAAQPVIRTSTGFTLSVAGGLGELAGADLVIAAASGRLEASEVLRDLRSAPGRCLVDTLAGLSPALPVAAACTGTLTLAEAGVLDGLHTTTSWWLGALFRSRYPRTTLDVDAMVVEDGRVTTAGAAFAHLDLALALVRRASLDLARSVAQFLLLDDRPAQSSYAAVAHLARQDPLVTAFERYVRAHLDEPVGIDAVASILGCGRRTLERRTRAATGLTPLHVVQQLRIDHARHLLATTDRTVDDVAHQVGYRNGATLGALLRRPSRAGGGGGQPTRRRATVGRAGRP